MAADDKTNPTGNGGGGAGGGGEDKSKAFANAFGGISFIIEFGSEHNNCTLCPITRRRYRGKWVGSNVKGRVPDDWFSRFPDLPGHMIVFDGKARTVTFLDPLDTEAYREVLAEAQAVLQGRGLGDEPDEKEEMKNQSDDQLKEWAYWCRRWVDGGQASPVNGTKVPEMSVVEGLPGRVRYNQFEMPSSGKKETYPNMADIPPYRPPVPPKAKRLKRQKRDRS